MLWQQPLSFDQALHQTAPLTALKLAELLLKPGWQAI